MPRRARLSLPGIPWHIIQRGNNRSVCFYAEEDYRLYLHHLQELSVRFGCAVHAYVLMTNHVHLLLTPDKADSAALLMKHLGQRYVQYVNRKKRKGQALPFACSRVTARGDRREDFFGDDEDRRALLEVVAHDSGQLL